MSARTSSSKSSEDTIEVTTGVPVGGNISGNKRRPTPRHRQESSTGSLTSQQSALATGTPYDTVSIATTTNTGFTNVTNVTANTSASQQQAVRRDVPVVPPPVLRQQQQLRTDAGFASAHQQYQQHTVQSGTDPYSGANTTSNGVYFQQAQFANQTLEQQPFNTLLGADAFKDVVLNIDYSVIEAYNVGIQSAGDITAEKLAGSFDAAKAVFNLVDTNHDGSISREEFRQWAQGGQQNSNTQSSSSYQTTTTNANPEIANILQQSGLEQAYANY